MNGYDMQRPSDVPQYKECPLCGEIVDYDTMIWLNGYCTCPACYEHRRREINMHSKKRKRRRKHEHAVIC